jgi:transcriptional regulator with XRE-family HTH domain
MDHPLIRWRLSQGLSQMALAFRCEVSQAVISACERYQKIPQGRALAKLLEVTGLPPEALTTPGRFLDEHPDFLGGPPPDQPPLGRPRRNRPFS